MNLADKLSLSRVAFAPIFVCLYLVFYKTGSFIGFITIYLLLIIAELTDYFDGSVARKRNIVSDMGKLLDPFCDTILQISIFLCFVVSGKMFAIFFLLLMYREFGMLFIRMLCIKNGVAVAARKSGKAKTVLFIFTCFWTLTIDVLSLSSVGTVLANNISNLGSIILGMQYAMKVFFILCVIASYVSFIDYLIHFSAAIKGTKSGK